MYFYIMKTDRIIIFLPVLVISVFNGCNKDNVKPEYITENVIVIVIDGVRFSEGWGDSTYANIPQLANILSKSGVVNTNFFNNGPTYTNGGHVSITTGNYQEIDNTGKEIPAFPSFFRYWNEKYALSRESSWIISSKSKLEVFNNCLHTEFFNRYKSLLNGSIAILFVFSFVFLGTFKIPGCYCFMWIPSIINHFILNILRHLYSMKFYTE
jgi:hypothetical protein